MALLLMLALIAFVLMICQTFAIKPNVIFMFADDIGFNDVGYNGYTSTLTPFIDELALTESLILSSNYVQRLCTPSRATFLTGRYPIRYGLQHDALTNDKSYALTRQVSLLSDEFKLNNYNTHMIGKWHLGFSAWEYTPTYRSFDTFSGFYSGYSSYWNHIYKHHCLDAPVGKNCDGHDLRINEEKAIGYDNIYGAFWERDQIINILKQYDDDNNDNNPFFMYIGWRASHIPSQAPDEYLSMYNDDEKMARRAHQAQTTVLDTMIKDIVQYLKDHDIWDNTLLVFSSDNGGQINFGDNSPLRGFKNTVFEGGIRVPGFVTGGYLDESRRGKILDSLVHSVDWYPTLLSACGLDINYPVSQRRYVDDDEVVIDNDNQWNKWLSMEYESVSHPYLRNIDGKDMWNAIQFGVVDDNDDREILLDMDPFNCLKEFCGVIRYGKWKYIYGNNGVSLTQWPSNGDKWFREWDTKPRSEEYHGYNILNGVLKCSDDLPDDSASTFNCFYSDYGCLYNMDDDPCETNDLAMDTNNLELVEYLKQRLKYYYNTQINNIFDENSETISADICAPYNFDGFWESYMKIENEEWEQSILLDMDIKYNNMLSVNIKHTQMDKSIDNHHYIKYFIISLVTIFILFWIMVLYKILRLVCCAYYTVKTNSKHIGSLLVPEETTPLIVVN